MLVEQFRAQLGAAGDPELGVNGLHVILDGVAGDPQRPGAAGAEELQRTACAVMAFGFAEVIAVQRMLNRIPVAAAA